MNWPADNIQPVERYVFKSAQAKVGVFDCPGDHPCFPVTESIRNNLFALATRPVWIRRNTNDYQYVGPGEIVLHPAGTTIERRMKSAAHDHSFWFAIRPDVFDEITGSYRLRRQLPTTAMCPTPDVQFELRNLLSQVDAGTSSAFDVEAGVLSLFDGICAASASSHAMPRRPVARRATQRRARRLADKAKYFIDEHLTENFDLHTLASEIGASTYHLCRLFKSCNGITVHEYRIRQRLAFTVQRLASGARGDLTDLALEAGFSSHSHLTKTFKSRLGFPPSAARF